MTHKEWLDNEYSKWIEALQSCTVHNFKENAMVQTMLGECDPLLFAKETILLSDEIQNLIWKIDNIGRINPKLSGSCLRMVYYALKVLEQKPESIVEIGGGVGEMFAILRALGYEGKYLIYDLPEVIRFQVCYRDEVQKQTGLDMETDISLKVNYRNFCYSAYAYGEFDDTTRQWYTDNVIKKCAHGLIIFNPHSGASKAIDFECDVKDEYPLTSPGNKELSW